MSWRRVPPVMSPVAPGGLLHALAGALGVERADRWALEARLAALFQANTALLTDSGTSALVLALRLAVRPGATVAMPGYGCIDMIAAAIGAGVRVHLYDVEPRTLSPDLDSLASAIGAGARAMVVAPFWGYPPDMARIASLAAQHGVPLIEDAAQAAGGTIDDRRLGTYGDVTTLSFGRGKGTTAGSGGALLVRGTSHLSAVDALRHSLGKPAAGWRDLLVLFAQWLLARPSMYAVPASLPMLGLGEMVYHAPHDPRALSNAAAATLPGALALDEGEVRTRRDNAAILTDAVAASRRFAPLAVLRGGSPGFLRYVVLDSVGDARPATPAGALRGYPVTLAEHPATGTVLATPAPALAGARTLRDTLFTLPTHSRVAETDMRRVREWLGVRPFPPTGVVDRAENTA
ncbi:MAG TPA: DegT/DnrJ/EryC1/StrS family aminotransferase [Gemmatimonadaceae bacterium]|nr:DegT/DnrJ/EryC1/StrS family aminotransferase [Gemmatimonadaceae bacterium]